MSTLPSLFPLNSEHLTKLKQLFSAYQIASIFYVLTLYYAKGTD